MKKQIHNMVCLAVCAATILFTKAAKASTVYTSNVTSGNWSTSGSWNQSGSGGAVKYVIQSGQTITLNSNISGIDTLEVYGTLIFANSTTLTIDSFGKIFVYSGASITGGNANSKIIFTMSSYQIAGPFSGNNQINGGLRYADYLTTIAAAGSPNGSFISVLLPVDLASIDVVKSGAGYELKWTALGESNKSNFNVEISQNGTDFYFAGMVAGNQEITSGDYNFSIIGLTGNFYIRLSETNVDGNSKVLATKYVKNNNNVDAFRMYPTLVSSDNQTINMVLPAAGTYSVAVYSTDMQLASANSTTTNSANEAISFNSSNWNLQTGHYFVVVTGNNGEVYKSRFMVK